MRRGWAVGIAAGWFFFSDRAPATAFGRAARMSLSCSGWGLREAADETLFCDDHGDERVLHLAPGWGEHEPDEIEQLKRFVQAVKEHSWSSHWHPPTGYLTDYNHGDPVKTGKKSLPL